MVKVSFHLKTCRKIIDKEFVTRGLKERKKQEPERLELNTAIKEASNEIGKLSEEKGILSLEQNKIEAEVGPIKYVAELIYGENAENNFDSAVRIVILILIFVFDPLAVLLLIAANISLRQWRMAKQAVKLQKEINLQDTLNRQKRKLDKLGKKQRDYKKMVATMGEFKDMSPDEIKVKIDQIYDWNDKV